MRLHLLGEIFLHEAAQATKVKPHRPHGDDGGVLGQALLRQRPEGDANALGVGIVQLERPFQRGLNGAGDVLLEVELLVKEGKHLGVVLADDVAGEGQDLLLGGVDLARTAPRHGVVEDMICILGVVGLLHFRSHFAVLDVVGIAPHIPLVRRPQLDGLGAAPATTSTPPIELEGRGADLRANVIRLALELASTLDHHSVELLHNYYSLVEALIGGFLSLATPIVYTIPAQM